MGLDMYLTRKKYIGAKYKHRNINGVIDIKEGEKNIPINFNKVSYIEEEVGYWRKANAIHKWFVDNVQNGNDDCREYSVDISDLEKLLKICKTIKEKAIMKKGKIKNGMTFENGKWKAIEEEGEYIENKEEIAELLPTIDGFFFGSTDYDEFYMRDIEQTITIIEEILKEEKEENEKGFYNEYYYQSSW